MAAAAASAATLPLHVFGRRLLRIHKCVSAAPPRLRVSAGRMGGTACSVGLPPSQCPLYCHA
eukprot:9994191-Prorocentrum_lima.AAC.1